MSKDCRKTTYAAPSASHIFMEPLPERTTPSMSQILCQASRQRRASPAGSSTRTESEAFSEHEGAPSVNLKAWQKRRQVLYWMLKKEYVFWKKYFMRLLRPGAFCLKRPVFHDFVNWIASYHGRISNAGKVRRPIEILLSSGKCLFVKREGQLADIATERGIEYQLCRQRNISFCFWYIHRFCVRLLFRRPLQVLR